MSGSGASKPIAIWLSAAVIAVLVGVRAVQLFPLMNEGMISPFGLLMAIGPIVIGLVGFALLRWWGIVLFAVGGFFLSSWGGVGLSPDAIIVIVSLALMAVMMGLHRAQFRW